jgi:hypothetical protein
MDFEAMVALIDSGQLVFAVPVYEDGAKILEGDIVVAFNGDEQGKISAVLATKDQARANGEESTGVYLDSEGESYFFGMEWLIRHPLRLVSRAPGSN